MDRIPELEKALEEWEDFALTMNGYNVSSETAQRYSDQVILIGLEIFVTLSA